MNSFMTKGSYFSNHDPSSCFETNPIEINLIPVFSNSIKIQKENLKGGIFLFPGVGLLLCFGILPICLAFYMSLHRWKPVQGRFMGLSHYEKAIGDLTSAILTLTALAMLIVGIWLLTRNWKQTPAKHSLTLCYTVGATMVVLLSWRVFELNHYVTAFQEGEAWALKMKRDMFLDRRGDPSEQLALAEGIPEACQPGTICSFDQLCPGASFHHEPAG